MLPAKLQQELKELEGSYTLKIVEESDVINVMITAFPTASHYNLPVTELLLRVPRAYPDAGLDMFWTDPGLVFASGAVPQAAEHIECYMGRQWRRFSWHHNGWAGAKQSIEAYLAFVTRRFHEAR